MTCGFPIAVAAATLLLTGCSTTYYLQAATGHLDLWRRQRPLEQVLSDPATSSEVRQGLLSADAALVFAAVELRLDRRGSYRHYVDARRRYVVWNVFAAPELSLSPRTWCYPVAGCAPYRGYFSLAAAERFAARLRAAGDDVFVGGVRAYSTLGWFRDPLLSSMLAHGDGEPAGLLFHELAHQKIYVPGDTPFNEGFASFVEQEGMRRWLQFHRDRPGLCRQAVMLERRDGARQILGRLRRELAAIYAAAGPVDARRGQRDRARAAALRDYRRLRASWAGPPYFDAWFESLDNAKLLALGAYEDLVPAFAALLAAEGGDLDAFYRHAAGLASASTAVRQRAMRSLAAGNGFSWMPPADSCPAG
jgi:predicted aminopeptidase